jgi:hypothetical protein
VARDDLAVNFLPWAPRHGFKGCESNANGLDALNNCKVQSNANGTCSYLVTINYTKHNNITINDNTNNTIINFVFDKYDTTRQPTTTTIKLTSTPTSTTSTTPTSCT